MQLNLEPGNNQLQEALLEGELDSKTKARSHLCNITEIVFVSVTMDINRSEWHD